MQPRQPPVAADAAAVGLGGAVRARQQRIRRFYGAHRLAERLRTRTDLRAPRRPLLTSSVAAARRVAREEHVAAAVVAIRARVDGQLLDLCGNQNFTARSSNHKASSRAPDTLVDFHTVPYVVTRVVRRIALGRPGGLVVCASS